MTPAASPMTASDAAGEARLADVTGMSGGDTGNYSYPPTASLGREGACNPTRAQCERYQLSDRRRDRRHGAAAQ